MAAERQRASLRTSVEPFCSAKDAETVWATDADLRQKHARPPPSWLVTLGLSYSAIGVIYGDIGTSPLYTVQSIFINVENVESNQIIAGISIIFWTLTLVVLAKYVLVVLQADDRGEGGTFALYTLICRTLGISPYGTLQKPEHAQLLIMSKKPALARTGMHMHTAALSVGKRTSRVDPKQEEQVWRARLALRADQAKAGDEVEEPKPHWFQQGAFDPEPIKQWFRDHTAAQRVMLCVAIISTSMVFGDGIFTPSLSVVSAIAGLDVVVEGIDRDVVIGVSCTILVILFSFQHKGTNAMSIAFSPIIMLWLGTNAAIGIYQLAVNGPEILKAFSPHWIGVWFREFGFEGWIMLGSVMLAVTGAEAMYSDLGHFDRVSVMLSFTCYVYPCLILTYMGQGAYLLKNLEDTDTAYWSAVPSSVFWPMIVLATAASIVASQALISACFSITKQAKVLGFMPKLKIHFTNADKDGQIYVSGINWLLMCLTIAVTAGFWATPNNISQAYGLTISMVMLITDILIAILMLVHWKLNPFIILLFLLLFGTIDLSFTCANMTKVPYGGWVAIAITMAMSGIMFVWWTGQCKRRSEKVTHGQLVPQDLFTFTTVGAKLRLQFDSNQDLCSANGNSAADASGPSGGFQAPTTVLLMPSVDSHTRLQQTVSLQQLLANSNGDSAPPLPLLGPRPVGEAVEAVYCRMAEGVRAQELQPWMALEPLDMPRPAPGGGGSRGGRVPGPVAEAQHEIARMSRMSDAVNHLLARSAALGGAGHDPTREELALLRGEFNLALKVPGASSKPLYQLPGIGLYYASSPNSVPPVMCHVMRNIEAVHKINIFVCVRHLPIPRVDIDDRLLVRCVQGVPNMYQCISRYGYMDHVDHGKSFVNTLVTAIVHLLEARGGLEVTEMGPLDAVRDQTISLDSPSQHRHDAASQGPGQRISLSAFARVSQAMVGKGKAPGPVAEGVQAGEGPSHGTSSAAASSNRVASGVLGSLLPGLAGGVDLREINLDSGKSMSVPALQVPNQPRLILDLRSLSKTVRSTSLATALSGPLPSADASRPTSPPFLSDDVHVMGFERLTMIAEGLQHGGPKVSARLEDAALRVAALLAAAEEGVVFYFGRTSLRMKPGSNLFHTILYDHIYKPMLLLSYAENEAWRIPVNNLVEMGMVLFI